MYGQSLGKHQQEGSSRWKLCFSCTPRDSNDWSISSLPACAMVETSSPVYLPSNFMVRFDQSSVRTIAGTSLWGHPSSSGLPKSQRARWSKSALGVSCCLGFRLTTIRPGSYFWPKSNTSLRHSSNGENGNLGSCSSHPAHPSHAAQLSAPNRKRGAQGAPSRYPPVPLCPRSAPSSPPSAAPCQTSARNR